MNPYTDEDVMWQRLRDLQREAENRRLIRAESGTTRRGLVRLAAARAWLLAGRAMRRRTWTDASQDDAAPRVA